MGTMLNNKVIVITGGASGIGKGIALSAAHHGAKTIVVADLSEHPREGGESIIETLNKNGIRSIFVKTDVSSEADVVALVNRTEEFGGVDVMVCNAGIALPDDGVDLSIGGFDKLIDVNLKGVFHCAKLAAEQMIRNSKHGSIIATSSIGGVRGSQATPGYSSTKGGVNLMVASLADALGPKGIRVNAVCPGLIKTALVDSSPQVAEAMEPFRQRMPLRRLGEVREVGEAVCWLGSDYSSFVTGVALPVDGGTLAVL